MNENDIISLHSQFEQAAQKEAETGVEFWSARQLQTLLGYQQWRNFVPIVEKAMTACRSTGIEPSDQFARARKLLEIGSSAKREVDDWLLTRYACYLIAQNGDPSKPPVAFAQTYFAVQTRKMEIIHKHINEAERIRARKKLTQSEKALSGLIFERIKDEKSFGRIRSKGDEALFGGNTTQQMKKKLGVPKTKPIADFLPTITIKAKDFANEITTFNIEKLNLRNEGHVTTEHVKNNREVRQLLVKQDIVPEKLPPAEDVKKIERRHVAESKKMIDKK